MSNPQINVIRKAATDGRLDARDASFALSLVSQFDRKGDLSPRQWPYVTKLAERAQGLEAPEVTGLEGVAALLKGAKVARPKVELKTDAGTLRLSVAGATARVPGSVNVTSRGSFHDRTFYGRIVAGTFKPSKGVNAETGARIGEALATLATDPAGAAAAHGHATGACSFCARPLSDDRSVTVGYGPICADKYGLPWGA